MEASSEICPRRLQWDRDLWWSKIEHGEDWCKKRGAHLSSNSHCRWVKKQLFWDRSWDPTSSISWKIRMDVNMAIRIVGVAGKSNLLLRWSLLIRSPSCTNWPQSAMLNCWRPEAARCAFLSIDRTHVPWHQRPRGWDSYSIVWRRPGGQVMPIKTCNRNESPNGDSSSSLYYNCVEGA